MALVKRAPSGWIEIAIDEHAKFVPKSQFLILGRLFVCEMEHQHAFLSLNSANHMRTLTPARLTHRAQNPWEARKPTCR